jgi:L-alanine-DL-glutamate epimerase-like enolase superfamily enzyme
VATIGIGSDEFMRQRALDFSEYQNLKIKLDAERPIERVRAVREVRPDATLVIDANQAWDRKLLEQLAPKLHELGVAMVEQPVARGRDAQLAGFESEIPVGADESCLSLSEYDRVAEYYQVINIKLDKCGGLTEALQIVKRAEQDGKKLMVGNMTGSSLSMAPAFVIAQFCDFVDIDGPLLLNEDIPNGLEYSAGGWVTAPKPELWG